MIRAFADNTLFPALKGMEVGPKVDGADADRFMAHLKNTLQEFDEAAL